MNNNQLITTNQNSKQALIKSKNLLDITKKILDKKALIKSFEFKPFLMEKGHEYYVSSVAISPDGKYIVSGSDDATIKVWDIKTAECLNTLEGHEISVISVAISPDGKYIVSGSWDETIKIWDIKTAESLNTLKGHKSSVNSVEISSNGIYIISGDGTYIPSEYGECYEEGIIKIWDIKSGECLNTLVGHIGFIESVAISPNGKYVVSGSSDNTIKIWDIKTAECLNTLEGHEKEVKSLVISPDGKYIVSGSWDKTIKIWDIKTAKCLKTLDGHSGWINSVAISPDGKYIISGSNNDKTIKIWDIKSAECLKILDGHRGRIYSVAISPDGKYIVSGSLDDTIKIWNIETAELIYTIDNTYNIAMDKNGYFISSDENIDKYIRVSEAPLTQRKLTLEEINHFRKKDNFLEIGEIIEKVIVEEMDSIDYDDIDENEIPF